MLDFIRNQSGSFVSKLIFGVIILVFVFWGVGNFGSAGRHTVGTVDGENITASEFYAVLQSRLQNNPELARSLRDDDELFGAFKQQLFIALAQTRAVDKEAKSLGLFVTPQELRDVIGSIGLFQNEQGQFDPTLYKNALENAKIVPGDFEQDYIQRILRDKLTNYTAMGVYVTEPELRNFFAFTREERIAEYLLFSVSDYLKEAQPSEEEIQKYYTDNLVSFTLPARGDYDYIFITPEALARNYTATDAEIAEAYEAEKENFAEPTRYFLSQIALDPSLVSPAELEIIVNDIIKGHDDRGESFAALAAKYSIDLEGQANGGEIGWIDEVELTPQVLKKIENLKKRSISEPIQLDNYLYIYHVNDKKEATTRSLEQVRSMLQTSIATTKASLDIATVLTKAEEGLRQGTNFAELAKNLGSEVLTTGLMPATEAARLIGLAGGSETSLSYVPAGKAAPAPFELNDGAVLVFVKDSKPEEIPAIELVREAISTALANIKAMELAYEAAQKTLSEVAEKKTVPTSLQGRVKTTQKFTRVIPTIAPLKGDAKDLVIALYSAPFNEWAPSAYATEDGVVIARTVSIIPAPEAELEKMGGVYMNALLQSKREMAVEAYMTDLFKRTKIVPNTELINQLSVQF